MAKRPTEPAEIRDVGGFVAPSDVPRLLDFLNAEGIRIIAVAGQHGEGRACASLLKKIKECAIYAASHGLGYLEASGILPPDIHSNGRCRALLGPASPTTNRILATR